MKTGIVFLLQLFGCDCSETIIINFTGMQNISSGSGIRSILNFRDAGGLKITGGGVMRKGLIYRSANPDRVNGNDISRLKELGIKTIIDLRGPGESAKRRNLTPDIKLINYPLDFAGITRLKLKPLITRRYNPEEINRVISDLYVELVDAARPVLSKMADLILEPGNVPLLIHCQAGKDRTGILSALLQMIAGADRQEIIGNYMASNDSMVPHYERKLRIRKFLTLGLFPSDAVLHAIKQKHEDILTVLSRVENHYGGIEGYLSGSGFDIAKLQNLRKILVDQ
jgi:protein-tyrosine phosphatase